MSLLNMTNDGMPNVLLALYRYLLAEGPTDAHKLVNVCVRRRLPTGPRREVP
ncbi:MAG: hypothetical protein U0792_05405 [Gemmataceae bacterium]